MRQTTYNDLEKAIWWRKIGHNKAQLGNIRQKKEKLGLRIQNCSIETEKLGQIWQGNEYKEIWIQGNVRNIEEIRASLAENFQNKGKNNVEIREKSR